MVGTQRGSTEPACLFRKTIIKTYAKNKIKILKKKRDLISFPMQPKN